MQVKKSCILQRYVEIKLKIMLFYVCSYLYAGSYLQIRQSVYACVRVTDEQKLGDCVGPSQLCAQIIGVPCYTEYLNAYLFLLCIVYAAFLLHTSSNICTVSKSTSFILRKNHPKFNAVKTALRRHMQSVSPHWGNLLEYIPSCQPCLAGPRAWAVVVSFQDTGTGLAGKVNLLRRDSKPCLARSLQVDRKVCEKLMEIEVSSLVTQMQDMQMTLDVGIL